MKINAYNTVLALVAVSAVAATIMCIQEISKNQITKESEKTRLEASNIWLKLCKEVEADMEEEKFKKIIRDNDL